MYNINYLSFNTTKDNVTYHGYRKASPKRIIVRFDREDKDIKLLEEHLCKITGETKDNHVLFEVKIDGIVLSLQFTDSKMFLGLGVEKQQW